MPDNIYLLRTPRLEGCAIILNQIFTVSNPTKTCAVVALRWSFDLILHIIIVLLL